jgi:hypothetical protein
MRVILALAALPLVVFALAPRVPVRASAPLAPTPVVSEGVGVIPLDARSFDARWWPDQAPTAVRVKTVPVRLLTKQKSVKPVAKPAARTAALPPPVDAMKGRGATKSLGHPRSSSPAKGSGGARQSGKAGDVAGVKPTAMSEVRVALKAACRTLRLCL